MLICTVHHLERRYAGAAWTLAKCLDDIMMLLYNSGRGDHMKRIPIMIPEEHHELLRIMAFENRTSISEEIRRAIEKYITEMKKEEQGK